MKIQNLFIWGVGGYLLYTLFNKGQQYIADNFGVSKIKVGVANFKPLPLSADLKLTFSVVNNTAAPIPFNSFFGTVKKGDTVISNVTAANLGGTLPANSTTDIDVLAPLSINQLDVTKISLQGLLSLLTDTRIEGMVHLGGGVKLPVNRKLINV